MNKQKPFDIVQNGKITSEAPSNIALIKYWGKYEGQIPANPSLSYTLTESKTLTEIEYTYRNQLSVEFTFEGKPHEKFQQKIEKYLIEIQSYLPFLRSYHLKIESRNTFPHSSGIASSASSFAALALGLVEIETQLHQQNIVNLQKASFLARLGSGSACRSIYNGLVEWGESPEIEGSSNEYAIPYPYEIKKEFLLFNDAIAIIQEGEKQVSSSMGHSLMENNPFAASRFEQARRNLKLLKEAIARNDISLFGNIIEEEALSLHAMMMTSQPSFLLMKPSTLQVIEEVRSFREATSIPIYFTLDAGANVHILYAQNFQEKVGYFLEEKIKPLTCNGVILQDKVKL